MYICRDKEGFNLWFKKKKKKAVLKVENVEFESHHAAVVLLELEGLNLKLQFVAVSLR